MTLWRRCWYFSVSPLMKARCLSLITDFMWGVIQGLSLGCIRIFFTGIVSSRMEFRVLVKAPTLRSTSGALNTSSQFSWFSFIVKSARFPDFIILISLAVAFSLTCNLGCTSRHWWLDLPSGRRCLTGSNSSGIFVRIWSSTWRPRVGACTSLRRLNLLQRLLRSRWLKSPASNIPADGVSWSSLSKHLVS